MSITVFECDFIKLEEKIEEVGEFYSGKLIELYPGNNFSMFDQLISIMIFLFNMALIPYLAKTNWILGGLFN